MKLQMVQNALKQKNIKYEYTEEDDPLLYIHT